MTAQRDLKRIIRARQQRTGEAYTTARMHVLRARAAMFEEPADPAESGPIGDLRPEGAVLWIREPAIRVRIFGEEIPVTFRSDDAWAIVPGQIVRLSIEKRWTWNRHPYACGEIEGAEVDVARLGLVPLPLGGGELIDLRESCEPFRRPDPYAPLWRRLTARPRPCFEMDPIAWGAFPGADRDDCPTSEAAEQMERGDFEAAREILMQTLRRDFRCIDAHAHLGHIEFRRSVPRALLHYDVAVGIGELSLPADFAGVLQWGRIYNRPFLRALHGKGLCLWRLGRLDEARRIFERILSLNPNDNQGVRVCLDEVCRGLAWASDENARPRWSGLASGV